MAAWDDLHGNQMMRDRNVRHTCSLCMEPYRGRHPKILPCFHTFCLPCLTALQDSAVAAIKKKLSDHIKKNDDDREKGNNDGGDGKGEKPPPGRLAVGDGSGDGDSGDKGREMLLVFLCPTCRSPVCVPEGGVSCLQRNFYLDDDDEEEASSPPAPSLCDMCEEGEKESAVCHCHQCQQAMCRTCRRYHDKLMTQHSVTAIVSSMDGRGKEEKEKKGVCLVHQDQALCFYCCQCQVPLCLHCKLMSHDRHDTVDMLSAVVTARKEMGPLIQRAQDQLHVVDTYLQHMDNEDYLLTHHAWRLTHQITERHHSLLTWAAAAHHRLIQEVKVKEEACRGRLMAERSFGAAVRLFVSSPLSRAMQALSHMTGDWAGDAVMVRNQLQQALLPQDTLNRFQDTAHEGHQPWGWSYSMEGGGVLGEKGMQSLMGRVMEAADMGESGETPPLSGRDLAHKMDQMSQMTSLKDDITIMTSEMMSQMSSLKDDITALQQKKEMESTLKEKEGELQGKLESVCAEITEIRKKLTSAEDERATKDDDLRSIMVVKQPAEVNKKMKSANDEQAAVKQTTQAHQQNIDTTGQMVSFITKGIDKSKTKDGSPIVFNNTQVNHGGCYDNTTGCFTASVAGCYTFTASIGADNDGNDVWAYIVVDGTHHTGIRGSDTSTGCGSVSVRLQKGQKVWVKANGHPSRYWFYNLWFTGALVQPKL